MSGVAGRVGGRRWGSPGERSAAGGDEQGSRAASRWHLEEKNSQSDSMTESALIPYRSSLSTHSPGTSRKVLNPFPAHGSFLLPFLPKPQTEDKRFLITHLLISQCTFPTSEKMFLTEGFALFLKESGHFSLQNLKNNYKREKTWFSNKGIKKKQKIQFLPLKDEQGRFSLPH